MRLFKLAEGTYEVELEPWVMLVPEFGVVVRKDKGMDGDYRGDKKLKSRKQLAYIYFCLDFMSPIIQMEDGEREEEALRYVGLQQEDVETELVEAAYKHYQHLQYISAPSLKTLESIRKGRQKLNKYFEDVDFESTDRQGRVKYTAKEYIENITRMKQMDDAIREYEKQVMAELKQNTTVRGKATLGGKEGKRRTAEAWSEGGPPQDDLDAVNVETEEV